MTTQDTKIKLFTNGAAKRFIAKHTHTLTDMYIDQWLDEQNDVKCYVVCSDTTIRNLILLSKMDNDPLEIQSNPFMLNYIYTYPEYRKNGIAYRMLLYLKNKEQMSAYTDNDISISLFKKAEFKMKKTKVPGTNHTMDIFTYP